MSSEPEEREVQEENEQEIEDNLEAEDPDDESRESDAPTASDSPEKPVDEGTPGEAEEGDDSKAASLSDVADDLPVLPLRGIVVYPMMWLPLTIGQERSIKLVEDALPQSRIIALATSKDETL